MLNLTPPVLISRLLTLVIAFTIHEFAHAWTANYFGDETPSRYGRLTLNPLAHLDPIGSLMLIFAGFGWAKPVPVNPYTLERHSNSAYMWVAVAGPFSNLMMAILASIPFRLGLANTAMMDSTLGSFLPTPAAFLGEFIWINLLLMLFNMIPLAPLDGEKVALFLLPPNLAEPLERLSPYGPIILMVLVLGLPYVGIDVIGRLITPVLNTLFWTMVG
jgi:Zn-dependent protease